MTPILNNKYSKHKSVFTVSFYLIHYKEKEVTLTIETPTECATEIQPEKIHESVEKMDTSQSAESSPWPVEIKNGI
jgi:hypothetical protein